MTGCDRLSLVVTGCHWLSLVVTGAVSHVGAGEGDSQGESEGTDRRPTRTAETCHRD